MLQPKRTKYRKAHRGRRRGLALRGSTMAFGEFGLKSLDPAWVTSRQIEAARRAITRHLRRGGQMWIRVFPHKPVSHKPAEVRQGGGKGPVEEWVAIVKPGRILFEIGGVPAEVAKSALGKAAQKLPVLTRMVGRLDLAHIEG